ncbi:MAG: hypothetical protein RIB60_01815 [Phycisphaerales bacterium]
MPDREQVLEMKLLNEELSVAASIERLHTGAVSDAAHHAARELTFDPEKQMFVRRQTGEATSVREWLALRREDKGHWFRDAPAKAARAAVPGAVTSNAPPTPVPGADREASTAPLGRRQVVMSEKDWTDYSKKNRHATVVSKSTNGGQPRYVVDVGSAANASQTSQMSMEEYRAWRQSVGITNGYEGVAR